MIKRSRLRRVIVAVLEELAWKAWDSAIYDFMGALPDSDHYFSFMSYAS